MVADIQRCQFFVSGELFAWYDIPVVDENGNLTEEAKSAIEILEQYAKTFQERNPNLYLFNCVMHLDEATPHLHIDYIPVAHGYKTGMHK